MKKTLLYLILFSCSTSLLVAQAKDAQQIKAQILTLKSDIRGPYKDIRWFCKDGSVRAPKDPCPPSLRPGVQHARYKEEVVALGKSNHIFLGQILTYTNKVDFWDTTHNQSRLKQYQLQKYLAAVDDGWVNRRGQYYRGAVQSEDEAAWGLDFYEWLLKDKAHLKQHYYLIRQSLRDIPHRGDDNMAQRMRSQSKVISDAYPAFMDLRIKIHGQPEQVDIEKVKQFKVAHHNKLSSTLSQQFNELIATMTTFFKPIDIVSLNKGLRLNKNSTFDTLINNYITSNANREDIPKLIQESAQLLSAIRTEVLQEKSAQTTLQLLDLSLKLETIIFQNAPLWKPQTLQELLDKIHYLGLAAVGAGYVELFEWQQLQLQERKTTAYMTLEELTKVLVEARSLVEWSTSMVKANFQQVVEQYNSFEPLSYGFIDDKIRSSIALHLGRAVSELGDVIAVESSLTNKVLDIPNQSSFRGLNAGYALGELVVVSGSPEAVEVESNKIYVFQRPPADLKPVAGIATVSEGNLVSHVQLLARNLGIPNAALSDDNLINLQKFQGQKVFYAVSNKGNVILKLEKEMTPQEQALFAKTVRKSEKIRVPVENILLTEQNVLNLRHIDASNSGKLCGPKAANLGQLKKMFPDKVVEGLVIPFGIFKTHMEQPMPGQTGSYWDFLQALFQQAASLQQRNISRDSIEHYQLDQLAILRAAIKEMPLQESFVQELEKEFKAILGKSMGEIPVFLRSDTNMEDLKDFTGAGLNLTLFNVVNRAKILAGIKAVWASPYTERSFKWRQQFLLNPENVFPSILIIPSVDVDYSGVLITKGISNGNERDLTVAFSRGAGGAVDGQAAETYLIKEDSGYQFLAPAREHYYNSLPVTGGVLKKTATFETPILSPLAIREIRSLAQAIRKILPQTTQSDYKGAYDVELGFEDNQLWLFQIRPFVENKKALSSGYLESITPKVDTNKYIPLSTKL